MSRTITIITILSIATLGFSQSFAPLGAEWKYNFHNYIPDYPITCEYDPCDLEWRTLTVTEIDTIEGKKVSILSYIGSNGTLEETPMKFHQEGDSVFYYFRDSFRLLYNFAAEPGDTLSLEVPLFHYGAGPRSITDEDSDSIVQVQFIVEDEGSIDINGAMRDRVAYRSLDVSSYYDIGDVVDGLGSLHNLFGPGGIFVATGCGGFFWCYQDDDVNYAPSGCCDIPQDYPERTFAPLGAEWLFEGWDDGTSLPNCESTCEGNYNMFRVVENERRAGRNFAKIQRFTKSKNTNWTATSDYTYLYDQDGVLYNDIYWNIPVFYDTNVEVGDTMRNISDEIYPRFMGDDNWDLMNYANGYDHVVEDVSSIEIDGQLRKRIVYRGLSEFQLGTVIEGIGPLTQGLLGSDLPIPLSGCEPRLICYRDSLITFTTDNDCGCEFPIGPNNTTENESVAIDIYPNPVTDILYVDYDDAYSLDGYAIYSVTGKLLKQNQINTTLKTIAVGDLAAGLYYLKLTSGIEAYLIKFVKE